MKDKDEFYKTFSREQLIERCEYLQRSCERKEGNEVELEKEIQIKNKYFEMIINIGCDYDGYNKIENLKKLIDELVDLARKGLDSDVESVMYRGDNKKYNILMEEVEDKEINQDNEEWFWSSSWSNE